MPRTRESPHARVAQRAVVEEITAVFEPEPKSGRRPLLTPVSSEPLIQDIDDGRDSVTETDVSDVVCQLARLSIPSSVPKLKRELTPNDIVTPPEAYILSLMGCAMSIQAIVDVSPMPEDETLHFVARLVTNGLVTFETSMPFELSWERTSRCLGR
jgi:hypothetical protein